MQLLPAGLQSACYPFPHNLDLRCKLNISSPSPGHRRPSLFLRPAPRPAPASADPLVENVCWGWVAP
jgi:hypothetical protein